MTDAHLVKDKHGTDRVIIHVDLDSFYAQVYMYIYST